MDDREAPGLRFPTREEFIEAARATGLTRSCDCHASVDEHNGEIYDLLADPNVTLFGAIAEVCEAVVSGVAAREPAGDSTSCLTVESGEEG